MAAPDKQKTGDGSDNFGQAAKKATDAARQVGKNAGKAAAKAGADAAKAAAAATVQGASQTGTAAAGMAAGTASGGPIGAILAALWAMRHTLFKILVSVCLLLTFLITMVVSLPSIIFNNIFRTDPETVDYEGPTDMYEIEEQMSGIVSECIQRGYDHALAEVEQVIEDGGYDYEASMESLVNYALTSDYDVSHIFASYSASMEQKGTTAGDMETKLTAVTDEMYPVTYEEKEKEQIVPLTYTTYEPRDITVITGKIPIGSSKFRYTTGTRIYFVPTGFADTYEPLEVADYNAVDVEVPVYSGNTITGSTVETYNEAAGTETLTPTTELIKYAECTIHPYDQTVTYDAFDIDPQATYSQFQTTTEEAIKTMADSLKLTLYGTLGGGEIPQISDEELLAFLNGLDCSATRKELIRTGLSLVGKVPYFWGGKSGPGWNEEWNTPKVVTSSGSTSTGTLRPYGLDCSGFTDWVYKTALGSGLPAGSANQWADSTPIDVSELLPGDLGFKANPSDPGTNHVLIFAGKDMDGNLLWVHCSSSANGVVLNSPSYVKYFRRPNGIDLESDVLPGREDLGIGQEMRLHITHYCGCTKCNGPNPGISATGKPLAVGMVATSSCYPFGTKIMIDGTLYTVEDRGGSDIEGDETRIDIYVNSHEEALRKGRFWTTGIIYLQSG